MNESIITDIVQFPLPMIYLLLLLTLEPYRRSRLVGRSVLGMPRSTMISDHRKKIIGGRYLLMIHKVVVLVGTGQVMS